MSNAEDYGRAEEYAELKSVLADLTPAEARSEVEAFLGDGWLISVDGPDDDDPNTFIRVSRVGVVLTGYAATYRAAVDALKQAWRDAIEPWERAAVKEYRRELLHNLTEGLEEDSNG